MIHGIRPQLAEAGKIKIGGLGKERTSKSGNKFRMPQKYSSFCVTTTQRNQDGDLIVDESLMASLPKRADGKCVEIPVLLHSDDIEAVFPTAYAMYSGRKLDCRGDGQKALRWADGRTKQIEMDCPCPMLAERKCKPHGTLHCSINLPGHAVAGAVYKWRTTSIISIQRMVGSLQQILATVGVLRGIPLRLKVEPVEVSPGDQSATVYCCHLELQAADVAQVQRDAFEARRVRAALAGGRDLDAQYLQLVAPPGLDESPAEQSEVAEEFHEPPSQPSSRPGSRTAEIRARLTAREDPK